MWILAISGSLRGDSSNTTLLRATGQLAPDDVEIRLYDKLAELPHFNPDLDIEDGVALSSVADFRRQLQAADGVLISTPEYAHGVPGVLKNALDWIVSSGEFMSKPVALLNASPHAIYAISSLTETLTVMMANIIAEASVTVPVQGKKLDEAGMIANPEVSRILRSAIIAFARSINDSQVGNGGSEDRSSTGK